MIEISNLKKSFGTLKAVDDVSFKIEEGEIFGLLGPNGAGKITTVKMITGMLRPDSGTIRMNGFDALADPLKAKAVIGYVPESVSSFIKIIRTGS